MDGIPNDHRHPLLVPARDRGDWVSFDQHPLVRDELRRLARPRTGATEST
jgi:hypothetical protein